MAYFVDDRGGPNVGRMVMAALGAAILASLSLSVACPYYLVWQQGLAGQAALRRAEQDRQIAVEEARARLESADLDRQAEILRAHGVAEANEIIADGLGGAAGYLRYLWIQGLTDGHNDVIYVPTEAQLPILEATRLNTVP